MRIGFDAKRLFNNFTGLGNYSRFVVEAMVSAYPDDQYFLFTPKVREVDDTQFFLNHPNIKSVVPSKWITKSGLGSIWRSMLMGNDIRAHGVDLYHGLSHELPGNVRNKVRQVVTVHDLIFYRYPQYYKSIDVAIYKSKLKHACVRADRIVAISEQTRKDLVEFLHVPPEKIAVVYQGCHENFKRHVTPSEQDTVKRVYRLPDQYILYVGTIEERKNALTLVKAFNKVKEKTNLSLVLVGRRTRYQDRIEMLLNESGLKDRVLILNKTLFNDLPSIYRNASLFVYPSLFEGFGIPLIEAIHCGVPVITSAGSCFREAAGPDAMYVNPSAVEEIADSILACLNDDNKRREMINKSSVFVERFEPGHIASALRNVYNSVLG